MESILVSIFAVTIAEIGDKTQLLALLLACKFKKPWPIIWGIFLATIANHAFASFVGQLVSEWFTPQALRWILGLSFLTVAAWTLVPDKIDEDESVQAKFGPFLTTLLVFFLVEMGDKTQVATIMLSARYESMWLVVLGSTLGMMLANVPVVVAGNQLANKLPLDWIRRGAAAIFAALGILTLLSI